MGPAPSVCSGISKLTVSYAYCMNIMKSFYCMNMINVWCIIIALLNKAF